MLRVLITYLLLTNTQTSIKHTERERCYNLANRQNIQSYAMRHHKQIISIITMNIAMLVRYEKKSKANISFKDKER